MTNKFLLGIIYFVCFYIVGLFGITVANMSFFLLQGGRGGLVIIIVSCGAILAGLMTDSLVLTAPIYPFLFAASRPTTPSFTVL